MLKHKPHPPPNPEWPDYVKHMYEKGCIKIDRLRKQIDEDGVCKIPFECYICEQVKSDFAAMNGDGCPMCVECLGGEEFVKEMMSV